MYVDWINAQLSSEYWVSSNELTSFVNQLAYKLGTEVPTTVNVSSIKKKIFTDEVTGYKSSLLKSH